MSVEMRVEGLDEIQRALKELGGRQARFALKDSTKEPARVLARAVKKAAPVDSGQLKESIRAGRAYGKSKVFGTGVKMAFYGAILHGGTDSKRGITFKHKGWISRAVSGAYRQSVDVWSKEIWKHIAKQWDKYVRTRRV